MRNLYYLLGILTRTKQLTGGVLFYSLVILIVGFLYVQFAHADETISTGVSGSSPVGAFPFASINRELAAQSFTTGSGGYSNELRVYIKKDSGVLSDSLTISLEGDSSGNPDGSPIVSASVANEDISTTCTEVIIPLVSGSSLSASTLYWIVFTPEGTSEDEDYAVCGVEPGTYADGTLAFYESASWSDYDRDMALAIDLLTTPGGGGGGGTTTTATSSIVINPTQDMFNGIMLFFMTALFFIWFFRRPYDTF